MYRRIVSYIWVVAFLCGVCGTTKGHPVLNAGAKSAKEALPPKVAHLLTYWPDEEVLGSSNRLRGKLKGSARQAKHMSAVWIKKVLDPNWLSAEKGYLAQNLIMIRDEFKEFDVTHVEWISHGYNIRVSQMAGIITLKLTPVEPVNMGKTLEEKRQFAKKLCCRIFNESATRVGIRYTEDKKGRAVKKSVEVPVANLAEKIGEYSFRPALVRSFPDGIIGLPTRMEDERSRSSSPDRADKSDESREDNPDWDSSAYSWAYWWRHVGWWHDGKSIGFFTLKTEAGSWRANYWDKFGVGWF